MESFPHSKFLLTEINSLGLLYGKLQDAYQLAKSDQVTGKGRHIYLFVYC